MFRYRIPSITIIFVIISIIAVQQASADVECWICNSKEHGFCDVNWDSSKVSDQDRRNHYKKCIGGSKCLKTIRHDGDKITDTTRGCDFTEKLAKAECAVTEIKNMVGAPNNKLDCLTCDSDGCNSGAQYAPIVLLVALPVAIAKVFLF